MRVRAAVVALCLVLALPPSSAQAAGARPSRSDLRVSLPVARTSNDAIRAQEATPSPDGSVDPDDPGTEGSLGSWGYLAAAMLLALWLWLTMRRARRR